MLLIWSWFHRRRRQRLLAEPFPPRWNDYLTSNVGAFQFLTPTQQAKLRDDLRVFIAEKYWEGCNGLEVTEEMQVTIAALACLLVLEMPPGMFDHVRTILVYPGDYVVHDHSVGPDGVVREGPTARHGEAWQRGPVILSWTAAQEGGQYPADGENLILHEFAHQLDMLDGVADGKPPLTGVQENRRWDQTTGQARASLQNDLRHQRRTLLGPYAATNPQEFFAVSTERFFENPIQLRANYPGLYELYCEYYKQDPASRLPG